MRVGYKQSVIGEIPYEWDVKELDEISNVTRLAGYEYSSVWKEDINGEIIALRGFNIGKNKISLHDTARISNDLSKKLIRSRLFKGDIVFPCVGTIGNAAVIDRDDKYHINQNIAKITPNKNINSNFLVQYLLSDFCKKEIFRFNATTSQPNVLVGSLRKFRIPIPPNIEEQQKIASILTTVDDKLENIESQITQFTQLKKGLMQQLLTKGIGHTEYEDSALGMIPKGWKVVKIDELGRFVNGGTPKTNNYEYWNGNINWCTPTEITALKGYKYIKNTNRKITEEGLKNSGAQLIPNNSLLVCTRATIGDCAINIGEFTTNQGFKSIIPNLNTNTEFLYYLICAIKPKLIMQSSGSTFLEISKTAFESIKIALPPLPEQQQIAYILTSVDDKLELLQNQKSEFASLKKGLMEQLLTGKVRVKV